MDDLSEAGLYLEEQAFDLFGLNSPKPALFNGSTGFSVGKDLIFRKIIILLFYNFQNYDILLH